MAEHLAQEEYKKNMKKIIAMVLLVIAFGGVYSQTDVTVRTSESAPIFRAAFTDVDSIVASNVYYSEPFDISSIQSQTLYLTDSLYSAATTTADTVLVILQGIFDYGNSKKSYIRLDTAVIVSNVTAQNTLSLTAYAPEVRFEIRNKTTTVASQNRNNKVLYLNLFANTTNYLRERRSFGNLP